MTERLPTHPIRYLIPVASVFLLLCFALPQIAVYRSYETQIWKQFWLANAAVACLAVLWFSFRLGGVWLRRLVALLALVPLLVLYWALSDHFDWHIILNRWLFK